MKTMEQELAHNLRNGIYIIKYSINKIEEVLKNLYKECDRCLEEIEEKEKNDPSL